MLRSVLDDEDGFVVQPRRSSRHPAIKITALAYADDIALVTPDPDAAVRVMERLVNASSLVGLRINYKKTVVMHFGDIDPHISLRLSTGESVQAVRDFAYLGVKVGDVRSVVIERRQRAWAAARVLRPIFFSSASDNIKLRLFRAAVESIFVYGLESLPLTNTMKDQLNANYRQLTRYALGIAYPTAISCGCLLERTRLPQFTKVIEKRRNDLVQHVARMQSRAATPLGLLLLHYPSGPTRRGHANTTTLMKTITAIPVPNVRP